MSIEGPGQEQLRELAAALKEAGEEGKGLRRRLDREIDKAARSLARKIADPERLKPYMPDRYAGVLAGDLDVNTSKIFSGAGPHVTIVAKGRVHQRKVALLESGVINHPVFARGPRRRPRFMTPQKAAEIAREYGIPVHAVRGWTWENGQVKGMRPGWFTDPCEAAVPDIREHILDAMDETAREIT